MRIRDKNNVVQSFVAGLILIQWYKVPLSNISVLQTIVGVSF